MNTEQTKQKGLIEAYPLCWPAERKRTAAHQRQRAPFGRVTTEQRPCSWNNTGTYEVRNRSKLTIGDSRDRVLRELRLLGARGSVISSNLRLKQDGLPMSAQREPEDPGVAVYFTLENAPRCVSCDRWDRAADNLAAIAKFIEAMRGQLRWGVGDASAIFAGFKALPASSAGTSSGIATDEQAAAFLTKFGGGVSAEQILTDAATFQRCYRAGALQLHPDRHNGQTPAEWALLQQSQELLVRRHKL